MIKTCIFGQQAHILHFKECYTNINEINLILICWNWSKIILFTISMLHIFRNSLNEKNLVINTGIRNVKFSTHVE